MGIYRQQLIRNLIEIMIQRWPIFLIEGIIIISAFMPEFLFIIKSYKYINIINGAD